MNQFQLENFTEHIANNFDLIKDKFGMTYDEFKEFSLGYTYGVLNTLNTENKKIKL